MCNPLIKIKHSLITFILLINISNSSKFKFKIRKLLESSAVNEVCSRASKEVKEFFLSGGKSLNDKEYDDNKEYIQKLLDLIEGTNDKNEAKNIYLSHLSPILFFIIFGLISIIIWPICLCCICYRCCNSLIRCFFCCCNIKIKKILNNIFFIGIIFCFGLGIIFAIYGTVTVFTLFESLDDASCSIFKIIIETLNGQETINKPKWSGIDGINDILLNLGNAVLISMTNYKESFQNAKYNLDNEKKDWESNYLDKLYKENISILNFSIEGPLKSNKQSSSYNNIIPEYIKNYGPYTKSNTLLNNLNSEYKTITKGIFNILDKASDLINTSLTVSVSQKLNETTNDIITLGENFYTLADDIADPWMNTQDKIRNICQNISKAISIIILLICLGIIIVLYVLKSKKLSNKNNCILKMIFYIIYNILFIFTIIVFLLFGFICILGVVAKDCSSVAHYIFSEENLLSDNPRVIKNKNSSFYMNVCINGNGDLKTAFGFDNSMEALDELYNLGNTIQEFSDSISSKTTSLIINAFNLNDYGNKYLNFKYYNSNGNDQNLISIIDEMNKYTKYDENTYQDVNNNYYDEMWSIYKININNYTYSNIINSNQVSFNSKQLLCIYDNWSINNLEGRYKENVQLKSIKGYDSVSEGVSTIYNILNNLKIKNKEIYEKVNEVNSKLSDKYSSIISLVVSALSSAVDAINPLTNVISEFLNEGNNSIYSIMNCAFIGYDVKFLLKQLYNGIGHNFYTFGSIMITMGIFLTLGLYLSGLNLILKKDISINEEKEIKIKNIDEKPDINTQKI